MQRFLLLLFACLCLGATRAQEAGTPQKSQLELFCGAELNYADVNYLRLYNILLNLTPGAKWHLGHDWQLAVQGQLPIINDGYDGRYDMVRLSMAVASKELHFPAARQHLKLSAGLFGQERYGADLRWMFPVCDWLLLNARAGLTRHWTLGADLDGNNEHQFDGSWTATATVGANVYLRPWDTEFRLSGGRYLNEDYGLQLDVMRHFRHCTVLCYGQLHQRGDTRYSDHREAGGFKVIVMLPPYKKSTAAAQQAVVARPASNFRLTYNAQADGVSMQTYTTDPEENERQHPMRVAWGFARKEGAQ